MADLATEPRWARINGTFGEDAELASRTVRRLHPWLPGRAALGPHSVACMTKQFPGGGPQKDGEDPHFPYGREQVYPATTSTTTCSVRGGVRGRHCPDHALLRHAGRHRTRGGRLRLQQGRGHRAAARDVRLRRRGLHRLGHAHRLVVGGEVFTEAGSWGVEDLSPARGGRRSKPAATSSAAKHVRK